MSHVVTVETKMVDVEAVRRAAARLQLPALVEGNHRLYSGNFDGLALQLPDWNYPVVIQKDGVTKYDNFEGRWGKQVELDKLVQAYDVEKILAEGQTQGYSCEEQPQEDGSIRLLLEQA